MLRDVPISDEAIRLGQLLKLANLVSSGGDVKQVLSTGEVRVNGEPEVRRGRTLHPGDEVRLAGVVARVTRTTSAVVGHLPDGARRSEREVPPATDEEGPEPEEQRS